MFLWSSRCSWPVLLSTSAVSAFHALGLAILREYIQMSIYILHHIYIPTVRHATSSSQVSLPIARRPMIRVFPFKYTSLGTISRSTQSDMLGWSKSHHLDFQGAKPMATMPWHRTYTEHAIVP
ncbi:hypothetical protein ARMSODRAFT_601293 [Armillaria solidipes]|uniref:Uncharacterized protein n=1 Tax=Armillaria solidipes TaxID=1076256 RepID=A0A2H3B6Q7_9AGAR|nr:hypothetical protein ARMSODRAFT_601293 [Armillaria solidipes]